MEAYGCNIEKAERLVAALEPDPAKRQPATSPAAVKESKDKARGMI